MIKGRCNWCNKSNDLEDAHLLSLPLTHKLFELQFGAPKTKIQRDLWSLARQKLHPVKQKIHLCRDCHKKSDKAQDALVKLADKFLEKT